MEIYLIRHTEPTLEKGICYGFTDIDIKLPIDNHLNEITKQLPMAVDAIFSSPLKRCALLANELAKHYFKPIKFDERLKELNFGDWELKPWNDINVADLNKWMTDYEAETIPNGESYLDLKKRVVFFLEDLKSCNYKKLIIVTHGGTIRTFLSILNNQSLAQIMDLKINYNSVNKISC